MSDYKELVSALRCSAGTGGKCKEDCPYRLMEEIKPDFPVPADVTIDGVGYWISCDCDRMAIDATAAIEQLMKERDEALAVLNENDLISRPALIQALRDKFCFYPPAVRRAIDIAERVTQGGGERE